MDEINQLVDKIEENMIRDLIISTDFLSIEERKLNPRKRLATALINLGNFIMLLRSVIGFAINCNSSIHFYLLNPLHGLGFMGRFIHGIFINGFSGMIAHTLVFFQNEKKGTLTVVTDLRYMYRKLLDPTPDETVSFMKFLKLFPYIR